MVLSLHTPETLATSPDTSPSRRKVKGTAFCHWLSGGDTTAWVMANLAAGGKRLEGAVGMLECPS